MVHRVLAPFDQVTPGTRVAIRWSNAPSAPVLAIAGFVLGEVSEPDSAKTTSAPDDSEPANGESPIQEVPYEIDLRYEHAYGWHYGTLFDQLQSTQRIVGIRCPSCSSVLVPPRALCEACYVPTAELVDVADTGVLQAFSIIHLEFVGQRRNPPYIYAEIILDGTSTRLIHTIEMDVELARTSLAPGARVRAVWGPRADAKGTLEDIQHFVVIDSENDVA